jgi:septal ring factor EnvC (AmiA/AmiB activator)
MVTEALKPLCWWLRRNGKPVDPHTWVQKR